MRHIFLLPLLLFTLPASACNVESFCCGRGTGDCSEATETACNEKGGVLA